MATPSDSNRMEDYDRMDELLPDDYVPSESDVICGWARQNYYHAGNCRLRDLIQENGPRYRAAKSKTEKGNVIMEILETIRRDSSSGLGLIKQNSNGAWYYIGVDKSKDKIGHALRKASKEPIGKKKKSKKKKPITKMPKSTRTDLLAVTTTSITLDQSISPEQCESPELSSLVSYDDKSPAQPTPTYYAEPGHYPHYPPPPPYPMYYGHHPYPPPPPPPYYGYHYGHPPPSQHHHHPSYSKLVSSPVGF